MALGATSRGVTAMILRGTFALAGAGMAIGVAASLAVGPAIRGMLFGVTPADPVSIAASAAVLLAIALLAGWLPARRAARVGPAVALRDG